MTDGKEPAVEAVEVEEVDFDALSEAELDAMAAKEGETEPQAAEGEPEAANAKPAEKEGEGDGKPDPANSPDRPDGYVPKAALREAREAAKAAQARVKQYEAWEAELTRRIQAQQQAQPQQQPVDPNAIDDPIQEIVELRKWRQQQEQERQQTVAQQQQAQQRRAFVQQVAKEFDAEAAEDPTYGDQWAFVQAAAHDEWTRLYSNRVSWEQYLENLVAQHGWDAQQTGQSMGQRVRLIAESRGYVPGWNQPPAEPEAPAPSAAEQRIDKIAKAQATNKTLGKGGNGSAEIGLEQLARMTGDELERFAAKNPDLFEKLHRQAS